ncbi:hypothetical protein BDV25DRAFT_148407 [Aspergillus avenaceus]|uniref:Phospholipase D n=1 Tax=Aspergillus avenaceus TaxID=36643 RepID=A0A5N6U5W8_ASPAV|nr:hypothetical protein BDV25DRAFT_148407 [Aspergillus avenaceus]
MPSIPALVRALYAVALLNLSTAAAVSRPRPIYAVAHRITETEAVPIALSHGANALEIDLTSWSLGWLSDNDDPFMSTGSSARELFETVASQRKSGSTVSFVWLDIKDPDLCPEGRPCSIEALRDLAREILQPAGIRVLYGFVHARDSRGYQVIRDSLNANEAIAVTDKTHDVLEWYKRNGGSVPVKQRVMGYRSPQLDRTDANLHSELRYATWARGQGRLGKVFAWMSTHGSAKLVAHVMSEAAVDGFIYGHPAAEYNDGNGVKSTARQIIKYVESHSDTMRMATNHDSPW